MHPSIFVVGRFPPPVDGQTIATQRLARWLEESTSVHRVDLSTGAAAQNQSEVQFRTARIRHYWNKRIDLRTALSEAGSSPILWTAISPSPLGHFRDQLTVLPAFPDHASVYAVIHWGNFDQLFRSPLTAYTARRLVTRLKGFIFLSQTLAQRCADWVPETKRIIIPNTIDDDVVFTDDEIHTKQASRQGRTTLRLLFLSNMIASKGYLDVLHALAILHQKGHPVQADFVGNWESKQDQSAFSDYVETHNLTNQITHHGPVQDRNRIKECYRQADVLLLPTYYPTEAQPLAIIEALNAGLPIITTRHASIPEMVRANREASFVPRQSPSALAEAVELLIPYETWLPRSKEARAQFNAVFHPQVVRQHWLGLLDGVVNPK